MRKASAVRLVLIMIDSARPIFSAWRGAGAHGAQLSAFKPATVSGISDTLRVWLRQHEFPLDDLEAVCSNHTTPLMHAARLGRADLIRELLELGARLQVRNADGNNALWLACFSNDGASVRTLLAAGIDIDNRNDNGSTCLMYAASAGKAEVVALLLAAKADVHLENLDGYTALDMAATIECLDLLRTANRHTVPAATLETLDGGL